MLAVIAICLLAVSLVHGRSISESDLDAVSTYEYPSVKDSIPERLATVHFLLWTRRNPIIQQLLSNDSAALKLTNFDTRLPTKIYAHGFTENGHNEKAQQMRDAFLKEEDCNFITIDWEHCAAGPNYPRAAYNSRIVGTYAGQFIQFLVSNGAPLSSFHLVGFSLGSHVVGFAGKANKGLIPRITGLDPAMPEFSLTDTSDRLSKNDAQFVDVMHTNSGGLLSARGLSFPDPLGHVDFYPNGGNAQPGCELIGKAHAQVGTDPWDLIHGCSHGRAPLYFIESVNSELFVARKCDSWKSYDHHGCDAGLETVMGFHVSTKARGEYYLRTNKEPPYAMGK